MIQKIHVAVDKPYDVFVGRNLQEQIANSLTSNINQIALIVAPAMEGYAESLIEQISTKQPEFRCHLVVAPDSEAAKNIEFVQAVWNLLGDLKFTRSDLIISIGGGATTDVAGFIAASWLRGIEVIHVPTTLLAMVDAAVGGKTGINTKAGKNLVGAFHHPMSVWCDLETLNSLPETDLRAGFAEVIKCGFISDLKIVELVEELGIEILNPSSLFLLDAIERAISVKAKVVAADFKENQIGGLGREILNYGHTFGHAIENLEDYKWRHGDAISVGMMFVAYLSVRLNVCEPDLAARQLTLFNSLGLPTTYSGDFSKLKDLMAIDKKARGKELRFIGLSEFGKPVVISNPSEDALIWAFKQVGGDVS